MAKFWSFLTFLALLNACLALPTVDPAGVAVDSQIDARDEKATVQGEVCATNGPWGSANGVWLKGFADKYASESGPVYTITSRSRNVCHQLACFDKGVPGTIWACLRERTVIATGEREVITFEQMVQASYQIYNRCPATYTGRALFQGQSQNWDIVVSGHICPAENADLNDPHWRPS
ncbi:hypothetical protein B0T18DRAFT_391367 [Schizothecium vesticola]|uniref:Secreted protein n=1 Tax=Schizothecium vesticola TaxID=314040 RepID=A0AA40K5T4_9PEZI|nr:hypothetical protein B0T18DRAFT_391367 [Schizothecium vesticola]